MHKNWLPTLTVTSLIFLLASCASVKVDKETVSIDGSLNKPSQIYVALFDTSTGAWRVDREGNELKQYKTAAATELQAMLMTHLKEIAPSRKAPDSLPNSGLLVKGEFTRINQGSRALRMGIGFGAGGTKVETRVMLYDLSQSSITPVATFETTGGSNAQPGLIAGGYLTGPAFAAANATGLTSDWNRTSREIRNFIQSRFKINALDFWISNYDFRSFQRTTYGDLLDDAASEARFCGKPIGTTDVPPPGSSRTGREQPGPL